MRTRRNVEESDATLLLSVGAELGGGTLVAARHARALRRPKKHVAAVEFGNNAVAAARAVVEWAPRPPTGLALHVGGPRASEEAGVYSWSLRVLKALLPMLQETEAYPRHDALLPYLASNAYAQGVTAQLIEQGYCVLPGVLSRAECEEELDRLWAHVHHLSRGAVRRDDEATWYPAEPGAPDPWPHTCWRSFSDMFQSHGAGFVFSALREKLADRVFEPLFGTRELHSSKEGFTFQRPTAGGRHPFKHRVSYVCGQPCATNGEHFDQGADDTGLHHIQSSTALLDQTEDDGCFLCWPGSHVHHPRIAQGTYRGRANWFPLTDAELVSLRDAGLEMRRVPVKAGDVILWRSDLAHAGALPIGERTSFRAVAYTAMLPACLTPPTVWQAKREAYLLGHTSDHAPRRECWHAAKGTAWDREYAWTPPSLTARQEELYGLRPYGL